MRIAAVIAEYNPFHRGHAWQLQKAREITKADSIVVIMSGNFVQRGVPAIIDKYSRSRMALEEGADLVLELPLYYSLSSIENYTRGAVSLAHMLGAVDHLCFGAEDADIHKLTGLALLTLNEDSGFQEELKKNLKLGLNYPSALSLALKELGADDEAADIMKNPNNALGIYYIRALKSLHSDIEPCAIKRIVSGHHERNKGAYSATAVRQEIALNKESLYELASSVPESSLQILNSRLNKGFPMDENDFSQLLFYKLHSLYTLALQKYTDRETARKKALSGYLDVNEELSSKILSRFREALSFEDLCSKLKSKDLTYTRISRCLLHILLDIKKENMELYLKDEHYYARILGLNKNAHELLHTIKEHSLVPIISKLADYKRTILKDEGKLMIQEDIQAADLYEFTACRKYNCLFHNEYSKELVIY
ncbi:MAG: nucleotidyltransferase family protein [Lachnospiraceae bacterium]|nr:nucleotidyltransferase family protein [Lachnospiraceae bacterium]